MEKSFNMKVEELKENLLKAINGSGLPLSSVYYLFKDLMQDLTDTYITNLNNEYRQYTEEEKENEEDIDKE